MSRVACIELSDPTKEHLPLLRPCTIALSLVSSTKRQVVRPYRVVLHKRDHRVDNGLENLDALGVELLAVGMVSLGLRDGLGQATCRVQRVEKDLTLVSQRKLCDERKQYH